MRVVTTAGRAFRHSAGAILEGLLLAAIIAALLVAFAPLSQPASQLAGTEVAAAAKGGGGSTSCHGKKCTGNLTATVNVSPNPVPSNSSFQLTGCGYVPNAGVQFNLYAPGVTAVWGGLADASGCLYNAVGWASAPGTARLDVLEGSVTLVASTTFSIQ